MSIPWPTVLAFAAVLSAADWFWVIALRGAAGAIERTGDPFLAWLRGSVLLVPLFAFAVLAALALAHRWFGPEPRRPRTVVATGLLIVTACTLAGAAELVVSAAYDYRLQIGQLDQMSAMGRCVGSCLDSQKDATLLLQLKVLGAGGAILLATNLLLVLWMVAILGGTVTIGRLMTEPAAPTTRETGWVTEVQLILVTGLVGTGTVVAARATADAGQSILAAVVLLFLGAAHLGGAHVATVRPGRLAWGTAATLAVGLPMLWLYAHTYPGPIDPALGAPVRTGLAEGAVGVLELTTLVAAVILLWTPAWLRRPPGSPHVGKLGVVAVVAVTAIGIGGSGLSPFDLVGLSEDRVPSNHHQAGLSGSAHPHHRDQRIRRSAPPTLGHAVEVVSSP